MGSVCVLPLNFHSHTVVGDLQSAVDGGIQCVVVADAAVVGEMVGDEPGAVVDDPTICKKIQQERTSWK